MGVDITIRYETPLLKKVGHLLASPKYNFASRNAQKEYTYSQAEELFMAINENDLSKTIYEDLYEDPVVTNSKILKEWNGQRWNNICLYINGNSDFNIESQGCLKQTIYFVNDIKKLLTTTEHHATDNEELIEFFKELIKLNCFIYPDDFI